MVSAKAKGNTKGAKNSLTLTQSNPNRFSRNQSEFRKGVATPAEQKMMDNLTFHGIDFRWQEVFKRNGTNSRGEPLTYIADFVLNHKIILEIEGEGSSSKDNDERDQFFKQLDYQVLHLPNEAVMKYAWLIAQFLGLIVGTNRPEVLYK